MTTARSTSVTKCWKSTCTRSRARSCSCCRRRLSASSSRSCSELTASLPRERARLAADVAAVAGRRGVRPATEEALGVGAPLSGAGVQPGPTERPGVRGSSGPRPQTEALPTLMLLWRLPKAASPSKKPSLLRLTSSCARRDRIFRRSSRSVVLSSFSRSVCLIFCFGLAWPSSSALVSIALSTYSSYLPSSSCRRWFSASASSQSFFSCCIVSMISRFCMRRSSDSSSNLIRSSSCLTSLSWLKSVHSNLLFQ
mmetsp:Transcript_43695/g.95328  ORF Transcript_43695/g.95328 Transcript_43695/m.95328 type:complete len:254 (+) Transcript_43695:686-1447(+)